MGVWSCNLTIQDTEGHKSVCGCYFPDATTLADAEAGAAAFVSYIDAIILGGVVAVNLSKSVDVVGVPTTIAASDVEEGAMFTFITDGGYYTRIRVPTFNKATYIPDNSDDVSITAGVDNFVTWMTLGDQPGVQPSDYRGDDVTALSTAKESYGKQRR